MGHPQLSRMDLLEITWNHLSGRQHNKNPPPEFMNRRKFLTTSALAGLAPGILKASSASSTPMGKAEHCIFIWLGGGMAQMDTFDPKKLGSMDKPYKKGSAYKSIKTAVTGVEVCEHLSKTAPLMDRVTAVRSVHHNIINEHAIASNFVHTGRQISGATVYPSIGSIVASQLGAANPQVPPYMLIGIPNVSRGPGFLGSKAGNIYLSDTKASQRFHPPRLREPGTYGAEESLARTPETHGRRRIDPRRLPCRPG